MNSQRFLPLIRSNLLPIALGIFGIILVILGLFQMVLNKPKSSPLVLQEAGEEKKLDIVVDIEGAVMSPGVYKVSADSRIVDVLAEAGGISEDANRDWVEKNINMAKKASDGLKIYIPRIGEEVLSISQNSAQAGAVININTASASDLESLPAVGPVTAQKIIDGRPYSQIGELIDRKIVGAATFEKIKDKISAD